MEKINESIKFSIVIPTYNRADFIKATVASVLQQDYSNFELIIVDDGSTDNTEDIIGSIHDERLQYHKKINEERGVARNYGFKKAKGDYVLFFDSDDLMHTNHLSTLYEAIVKFNNEVNFIASKYDLITNNKHRRSSVYSIKEGWYGIDIFLKGSLIGCNICVKKNNPNLKLFHEDRRFTIGEDWIFLLQNLQNDKIYIIDKVTISVNDHENRTMRSNNSIIISKNQLVLEWLLQNIKLTSIQQNILTTNSYYFCAIHSYIDNNRSKAMHYLRKILLLKGFGKKEIILFIKVLIGYRIMIKVSTWFQ